MSVIANLVPAREPAAYSQVVDCAAQAVELNLRQNGCAHVWAWPAFQPAPGAAYLPGVVVAVGSDDITVDPYAAHRRALPIYIRPRNYFRWAAVPYSAIRGELHDALKVAPIMGAADPY